MLWLGCPMLYGSAPGTFWMLAPGAPGALRPGELQALVRDRTRECTLSLSWTGWHKQGCVAHALPT